MDDERPWSDVLECASLPDEPDYENDYATINMNEIVEDEYLLPFEDLYTVDDEFPVSMIFKDRFCLAFLSLTNRVSENYLALYSINYSRSPLWLKLQMKKIP